MSRGRGLSQVDNAPRMLIRATESTKHGLMHDRGGIKRARARDDALIKYTMCDVCAQRRAVP